MATGNAAEWRTTLGDIERAVRDCLTALDRYESAFAEQLLPDEPARGSAADPADPADPGGGRGWDEKLAAAGRSADEVERLLAEQEAVWGRWREALAGWRQLAGDGSEPAATKDNGSG